MNLWQRIFNTKPVKKGLALEDMIALIFPTRGGDMINSNAEALEQSVWILRAIQAVSQTASTVPWHITDREGKIDERAEEKLRLCNPDFTFTEIHEKSLAWQCIEGYAPWYVEMGVINIIDADMLEVKQKPDGSYSYRNRGFTRFPLLAENIILFPNFTPYNKLTGLSELKACIDMANLGENALRLANNIMLSGGLLTGLLSTEQDLSLEEAGKVKAKFRELYGGIDKSGEIGVFGRGLKWTKLGISPGEFSMLDITKVTRNGVSVAFGVPEVYLSGTETVDYANSKTQDKMFFKATIKPKNDRFADRITRFVLPKLLNSKDRIFSFDWSQVEALQEDREIQARVDDIRIRNGMVYINELRARDSLEPVPWGNDYWGSLAQIPLGTVKSLEETVAKIDTIYSEIKKIKEDSEKRNKKLSQEAKDKIWYKFIARTDPQEKRLAKEVNKYLDEQKEAVLKRLAQEAKGIEDIDFITEDWEKKFAKMLKPFILAFMQQAGDEAVSEYGIGISFDLQRPEIQKWIEWKLKDSAVKVSDTAREAIKEQLKEAVKEGEGISQMADRIRHLFEETYKHRAETISRTEVISANNKAHLEGMEQAGIKTKEWLSAIDERTRPTHVIADGQIVGINEKFKVGGYEADFPGDPNLPPEEVVNCRCSLIYSGE